MSSEPEAPSGLEPPSELVPPEPGSGLGDLDIRSAPDSQTPEVTEIDQHSPAWAEIVRPIANHLLALLSAIMLIPFVVIALLAGVGRLTDPIDPMLDWAKTILPPLVGFGGAIVGYYFGTRGSGKSNGASEEAE
jgi:hypothetical protein